MPEPLHHAVGDTDDGDAASGERLHEAVNHESIPRKPVGTLDNDGVEVSLERAFEQLNEPWSGGGLVATVAILGVDARLARAACQQEGAAGLHLPLERFG